MIALAAACAALAGWLLVPPAPVLRSGSGRSVRAPVLVAAAPVLAMAAVGGSARLLLLAGVLGAAAASGLLLVRQRRARLRAAATSARVLESCEELAAELAAGRPPGAALSRAAEGWSALTPAAAAFAVGSDVPAALRSLAAAPGAHDLRVVAAAWQVSQRTGQGLGQTIRGVADDLRAAAATRRVVDAELASARATARLVAALPVAALTMGSGSGGDPWAFLLGHPVGLACLAAGLAFGVAGLAWIEALARGVDRPG
ncbi:type II secretion system F family protein [Nocardioides ferulae]|uniref:type II secretion system F family protein n=1 Tax=Nocardioides ferulae TaxID=2340821 RepID=UPI000EB3125B|nr:type II secretion system F family protein [Nocardioides ferulae]